MDNIKEIKYDNKYKVLININNKSNFKLISIKTQIGDSSWLASNTLSSLPTNRIVNLEDLNPSYQLPILIHSYIANSQEFIVRSNSTQVTNEDVASVLQLAAKEGHEKTISMLLASNTSIPQDLLVSSIQQACENKHIEAARFMIEKGDIHPDKLGFMLRTAAKIGHVDIVCLFLATNRIGVEAIGWTLQDAVKMGHLEVVRLIVQTQAIDEFYLSQALRDATILNHIEIVQLILDHRTITPMYVGRALQQAARDGNLEMVRVIFYRRWMFRETDLGRALSFSATEGHLHIFHLLFSEYRMCSLFDLGQALSGASKYGHTEIVERLLSTDIEFLHFDLRRALHIAAYYGQLEIIRLFFLEHELFSDEDCETARVIARDRTHPQCAEFLLQQRLIQQENRRRAIPSLMNEADASAHSLHISLDHVLSYPLVYLSALCMEDQLPHSFVLAPHTNGSIPTDIGGVSKQFYSTLFYALHQQGCLCITSRGIPFVEQRHMLETYRQLGKLYYMLFQKNRHKTDPFLSGTLFSPHFFYLASLIAKSPGQEDLTDQVIPYFLQHDLVYPYSSCFQYLLAIQTNIDVEAALHTVQKLVEDIECQDLGSMQCADKHKLVTKFCHDILDSYVTPIRSLLSFEPFQKLLNTIDPLPLCEQIQGLPLSRDQIIQAIQVTRNHEHASNPSELDTQVMWIQQAIRDADMNWLIHFMLAITGQSVLAPKVRITLYSYNSEQTFRINTCYNSLGIPTGLLDQKMFVRGLTLLIEERSYNAS